MTELFRTVKGKIKCHARTEWLWPVVDTRLVRAVTHHHHDIDSATKHILNLCLQRRTCIQAGGAMGVWPVALSKLFDNVVTFEAHPDNYHCLLNNTDDIENIESIHAALGKESGCVDLNTPEHERGNSGAYFVSNGTGVDMVTIDSFGLSDVDLIYLDVEGSETDAILGATKTIAVSRPIIGLEDKDKDSFYIRFGYEHSPVRMLVNDFDYVQVERYGLDVILVPIEKTLV